MLFSSNSVIFMEDMVSWQVLQILNMQIFKHFYKFQICCADSAKHFVSSTNCVLRRSFIISGKAQWFTTVLQDIACLLLKKPM